MVCASISVISKTVLPGFMYSGFLNLLLEDCFRIPHLLGKYTVDRVGSAEIHLKYIELYSCEVYFLKALLTREIEETASPDLLFRENSMASKVLCSEINITIGIHLCLPTL